MKASAIAHAIQGLIKYHGLRDRDLRIPFHDSISVCAQALYTITTVEFDASLRRDEVTINNVRASERESQRVKLVLDALRKLARTKDRAKVISKNSLASGKGLGFSASGFAALGLAASSALDLELSRRRLSEIVRLGTGSATRSLAGGFAIWYANRDGHSYGEQLATEEDVELAMAIVPIPSNMKTEMAHQEATTSPFFKARLRYLPTAIKGMKRAIRRGDTASIGVIAEADTLNLHGATMTGRSGLILFDPRTIEIIRLVVQLREEQKIPTWFSIDTGPSVFINTYPENLQEVERAIKDETRLSAIASQVGSGARLTDEHLV